MHLVEGMQRAGLSDESMLSAARPKDSFAGYLELHIEQGKRLERARHRYWHCLRDRRDLVISAVVHRARGPCGLDHDG